MADPHSGVLVEKELSQLAWMQLPNAQRCRALARALRLSSHVSSHFVLAVQTRRLTLCFSLPNTAHIGYATFANYPRNRLFLQTAALFSNCTPDCICCCRASSLPALNQQLMSGEGIAEERALNRIIPFDLAAKASLLFQVPAGPRREI